jgi:hypothetical protein
MTPELAAEIRRLRKRNFTRSEIMKLTGATKGQCDYIRKQDSCGTLTDLELAARKLLYQVPVYWEGTTDEWRKIVRANFADVLGA